MGGLQAFLADETGGTAIEYALIALLLGTGLIGTLMTLGTTLDAAFAAFADAVSEAMSG